jgi:pyruvate,orthophosphate dikinase
VILAADDEREAAALEQLLEAQREDFAAVLEAMDGLPVTIRLLDPPLHEFLPSLDELIVREATGKLTRAERTLLDAARSWHEQNPMIGTRGVRLGVIKPGLYGMQVRAVVEAALARAKDGGKPVVEIMIPLTVSREEMAEARGWVTEAIGEAMKGSRRKLDITIGTMIETPRAAVRADEIAEVADFFSFGTNDLTQMTFGFSRDDVEGRLMPLYLDQHLLPVDPFRSLDVDGVGRLVRGAVDAARASSPGTELGVCGEHGGDPTSITFFHEAGFDEVSCSPHRVATARLAAARAAFGDAARGPGATA